jgi:hypothetical protein
MSRNRMFDRDNFTSSGSSSPSWLDEFAVQWEKTSSATAVEAARLRQSETDYYSQISSIVSGKKKHATVDSIVKEYQELTGLKQYLKTLAEKEDASKDNIKTAQDMSPSNGTVINNSVVMISVDESDELGLDVSDVLKEKIKSFVNNKVNSYYGHISIPAIQDDLLKSLKNDGLEAYHVYDSKLSKFIGKCLESYNKNHPRTTNVDGNLGKAIIEIEDDGSNRDFLHSLQKK